MRVAVLLPAAGCPGALASSAFHGALMEGLAAVNVDARVVGLALHREWWNPDSLGPCDTSTPWLPPTPRRAGDRAEALRRGIFSPTDCDGGRLGTSWRLELLLERDLLEFAPEGRDHVLLVDSRSYALLRLACRVARRLGWRVVVFCNEALIDTLIDATTRDDYVRCVAECTAGIWAVSDYLADYWESVGVPRQRIFVSPLVVRQSSLTQTSDPPGSASAAYIGNLSHREIDYLLDISEWVAARLPEFNLSIYGDAPAARRDELERAIDKRALTGVVFVKAPVTPIDIPRVLAAADVLLLPRSRGEFSAAGFPNKIGEYLASGRPVVVTGVGDIPKYLEDARSALVVDPDDNEAFAAAVLRLLTDPAFARAVGEAGKQVASTSSRADLVASRFVAFLATLPPAPSPPAVPSRPPIGQRFASLLPDPTLLKRDLVRLFPAVRRLRRRP